MKQSNCYAGLNALHNIGLKPAIDKSLDIAFLDLFELNTDLCKLLNRYAYQGKCQWRYACPTLYIDGKDIGTLENLKIQEIKALSEPSSFELESKDQNVRKAFEIKGNRINLGLEYPREIQNIAPLGYKIKAKLSKLAIYDKDGIFSEHSETLYEDNHMGTLLMCLPTPFEGGTLILSDDRNELRLDFDEMLTNNRIAWVVFSRDVRSQVEVVNSGLRMILQFDLTAELKEAGTNQYGDDEKSLEALFGSKYTLEGLDNVYEFQDYNKELLKNIENKLKAVLSRKKVASNEIKSDNLDSEIIKKRDRPEDDEPLQLEQPQSLKQDKADFSEEEEDMDWDEDEDEYARFRNPNCIAILLRRNYGCAPLSPERLKGIDSTLYHALKDNFIMEVKYVILEQCSSYDGKYGCSPILVSALAQIGEQESASETENQVCLSNKYVPKKCNDDFQTQYKLYRQGYGAEYNKYQKRVCLVTGSIPKTISKIASQDYNDVLRQPAICSYMHAALFIYPN